MDVLLLRFNAPLMSFGAPIVDRHGVIQPYPALSMITGLLGNALGLDHTDFDRLQRLQDRIVYASRQDRRGQQIRDYQTVDLSQEFMRNERAWTTWGELESRKGGTASSGTHERLRDYWADSIHTVALTLQPEDESPTLVDLERALKYPERPLFVGRKCCLPAASIFVGRTQADDLVRTLQETPLANGSDDRQRYRMWWPSNPKEDETPADIRQPVTDHRDWANQIHVGERWIAEGELAVKAREDNHE